MKLGQSHLRQLYVNGMSNKKLTKEEFIAKARAIHGDKYNYDKVVYVTNKTPVIITCPEHGDFPMLPINHINKRCNCPECAKERMRIAKTDTLEGFISKAKEAHGDKYDYSKVIYVNRHTPVTITCQKHGDFPQNPYYHIHGGGCPKCSGKAKITNEIFIEKARAAHGDKYDYSLVEIKGNNKTKVKIKCSTCGAVFEQKINNHLNGQGCPWCKQSHLENDTMMLLEKSNIVFETQKTFPWLKSKGYMSLDFYLPKYNIAIECQGIQHYESNGFFTEKKVEYTQQNDSLKQNLCKKHNMPIYYIKYNDNIEEKLNEIIEKLKK